MSTKRTYGDGCGIARALDLVGERWALIVVRELLLGPKRFTDLQAGMSGASPNVLALRLRELEAGGVVRRRKLGPPAGSRVYELTEWGYELEPALMLLGRWGVRSAGPAEPYRSVDSMMLWQRTRFDPVAGAGLEASYALLVGDDCFVLRASGGELTVARGAADRPAATVGADLETMFAVLTGEEGVAEAAACGRLTLSGDPRAVDRLLDALRLDGSMPRPEREPGSAPEPPAAAAAAAAIPVPVAAG
ncbi:winged helix-turn-helix transcriptional regulator [Streptomyces sp. V4-01]|uniref:Winged helix-turn-helix transcriptional regulator n=1 Tax=Actinacidiphila polyblastidii TaxID=3110430 RepID=A0ABU7PC12_9ACTN|nr:winged helix-turn-helix transcriptional regulator [Streptomyces sp. V4-01]